MRHAGRGLETELLQRIRGRQTPWKSHRRGTGEDHRAGRGTPPRCTHRTRTETNRGRTGTHDALRCRFRRAPARCAPGPGPAYRIHRRLAHLRIRHGGQIPEGALHARDRELRPGVGLHHRTLLRRRLHAHRTLRAGNRTQLGRREGGLRLHHARAHDAHLRHGGDAPLGLRAVPARHRGNQARNQRFQHGNALPGTVRRLVRRNARPAAPPLRRRADPLRRATELRRLLRLPAGDDPDARRPDDLGAGYHPNLRGQCKMAAAVIPYIATLAGWPMPQDRPIR